MWMKRRLLAVSVVAAVAALAALSAGCGEPAQQDPTPVRTWMITPASEEFIQTATARAGGSESPGETPPATEGTPPAAETPAGEETPAAEGTVLELAGVSSVFDLTELEAPAGPITIVFDNRDGGVIHNLSVFEGDDATGELLGSTDLESGPIVQELKLDLEAGEYFYQCDAHPTTMKGTLTIT